MKKILSFSIIIFIAVSAIGYAKSSYKLFKNEDFNYQLAIPSTWNKTVYNLKEKSFLTITPAKNVEVKLRVFQLEDKTTEDLMYQKKWDLRKIDPSMKQIIEKEPIKIQQDVAGDLFVFEYKDKTRNILQRTMIMQHDNLFYILDCCAPVSSFSKYDNEFSAIAASFAFLDGSSNISDPVETTDEDKITSDTTETTSTTPAKPLNLETEVKEAK